MTPFPFFQETDIPKLPALVWLHLTRFTLGLAVGLFALSVYLGHSHFFERCAVSLLRFARRLLGHTSSDPYLQFRADLPMEI